MTPIFEYIKNNWHWIAPLALWILVSFANAATKHYSTRKGKAAWFFGWLGEMLSFLPSSGTRTSDGPTGGIKLPGQSVKPK